MLLATLDSSKVIGMKIGPLGQFLLAETGPSSLFPDRGTEDNAVISRRWHSVPEQQSV